MLWHKRAVQTASRNLSQAWAWTFTHIDAIKFIIWAVGIANTFGGLCLSAKLIGVASIAITSAIWLRNRSLRN